MIPDVPMDQWWSWIICVVCLGVGVIALWKCSDMLVDGSSSIAKKLKVSSMIIGLTVVAFGTSCPELAVSVSDSITCLLNGGYANVAIGNVVGSNICNILIVLGISAIFTPIVIDKSTLKKEFPIMLAATALCVFFTLVFPKIVDGVSVNAILRWEGAILVAGIVAYVLYLVISAKKQQAQAKLEKGASLEDEEGETLPIGKAILFTVLGLVGVIIGGEAVVYGAKNMATGIGTAAGLDKNLVESLVGLTIVAVGTSLPELIVSVSAARKGEVDMALGNVLGSNIFNILFVLGIGSVVNPLTVGNQIWIDLVAMSASAVLLFAFAFTGKLRKWQGWVFVALYAGYVAYLVTRTIVGA
ncbi:MAG: calcium/sodium antiporter [Bacilli bacterium]|nr:calcium/sodium antiporter [Bacilli bacterium]